MNSIAELEREHEELRHLLTTIEGFIDAPAFDHHSTIESLRAMQVLWDAHEVKEESLFASLCAKGSMPVEKMFIEQHQQLRGHWHVLSEALTDATADDAWVALDTDGRMLFEKLRQHMDAEDRFLAKNVSKADSSRNF